MKNERDKSKSRRSGQIIDRGENKWLVRVAMGRDEATGKRRYINKTIRGSKKDAQKWLTATLREVDLGIYVEPAAESLSTYLDKWLKTAAKPKLRAQTYDDYDATLRRYAIPELGKLKLSAIRPLDIQTLYSKMQERGLSARMVRYTHTILSSALKQAVRWGMLSRNPAELVQLPKLVKKEMRALSADEVGVFLAACEEGRYKTLFAFAIATGLRPEEYFGLLWKDLDLEQGTVSVVRALVRPKGGGWRFDEVKTTRSRRSIPLPASIAKSLAQHRREQLEERVKYGNLYKNNEFVFATETGEPMRIDNLVRRQFKPALVKAGLPKSIRLYDLRHTCATLLLLAGENPKVVSERLGHAGITLTLDTYSHVLPDMQRGAAEKLERMMFGTL